MAEFLTTKGTASKIEEIMIGAQSDLVLISPYLQISNIFLNRISEATKRGIRPVLVFGKGDMKISVFEDLARIRGVEIRFLDQLHAKCYYNESKMVITSMNLYEYSEKNNVEMGVFIDKRIDSELFSSARREGESILNSARKDTGSNKYSFDNLSPKHDSNDLERYVNSKKKGHCIRCNTQIELNPERPYCGDCYSVWSEYSNYDYTEKFCHGCGRSEFSSMNYPDCESCYKNKRRVS